MINQLYTERVYIDPQRLIKLKKQRKPFAQVLSIFEPPPQNITIHETYSLSNHRNSISSSLKHNQPVIQQVIPKTNCPNVDFILNLLGDIKLEQVIWFQEGDCLSIRLQERCLILEGEVKVTGVGNRVFTLGQGNILFINSQTISKIKEIICVKASRILKLSDIVFASLHNYIFLKNAQKIKYLKYCPFFIWSDTLSEDLASCMTMRVYERGQNIYSRGDLANHIFFVKQGVVLLERSTVLGNSLFQQYQTHYQRNELSSSESILIVKKGMVFGIDGILLKDIEPLIITSRDNQNPQEKINERNLRQNTRVYSARTLGRTEVYVLQRSIIEGLFDVGDISSKKIPRQLSKMDLQQICSDYADMVVRHRSLPKIVQAVVTKQIILPQSQGMDQLVEKKTRVKEMRKEQEIIRKHSIANIISDCKSYKKKQKDINNSIVMQQHFSQKLGILEPTEPLSGSAFPRLNSNLRKKRGSKIDSQCGSAEKYIMGWLKCDDPLKRQQSQKLQKQPKEKLTLFKVRSYRSIIPSIV